MSVAESGPFPSLVIKADALEAEGSFAQAQALYLDPDPDEAKRLRASLEAHAVGVVAHYYMDPEIQGLLHASRWDHVHVSDSLVMADAAVRMVESGARIIVVLGVDFMSENVRAILDAKGHHDVPVYRVAQDPIGCTLAEAADSESYKNYLRRAQQTEHALHVVYINTSLDLKAKAHHMVPTITATSSNVVATVLQAFAQVPDLNLFFGPDTYMGQNLKELLTGLLSMDDDAIQKLHKEHSKRSVEALLKRFHHFEQGVCIVHHMFGQRVVEHIQNHYSDACLTAHLEVPGEMFRLALDAQQQNRGVVGSTSNILDFVKRKLADTPEGRVRFVLGTEAGMVTSIVQETQALLKKQSHSAREVEIIFPVADEAIAPSEDQRLGIVPGVAGGEGCSTAGGCATCPFMKMNSLDALHALLAKLGSSPDPLRPFHPKKYTTKIDGQTTAEVGTQPILHMRAFQHTGQLPDALVTSILSP